MAIVAARREDILADLAGMSQAMYIVHMYVDYLVTRPFLSTGAALTGALADTPQGYCSCQV